ncbi:succinate dehydrogenase subunit 7A, mitochondrial-like [Durio zibethinus]|uniref:Succinate dehydrogenase subunit 7A, mitochondrial-like n=1 Tax=Durio zibethinus TaxID=66656 RepID=A0A6P6AS40_DURZI|nr:succinate dehydrogenase subunit 7A, mitochondrial-like [Durio zibethinus]XP_022767647.1 succinate dehydrogenase subunit 7A, mitochondrial-like [Durio zibethinus]
MAFFLQKSSLANHFRSSYQKTEGSLAVPNRAFHVELGDREKALLAKDPSLSRFKSYKKNVWRLKRIGDVLTIVVVAGCCYEIYVKAAMREEARNQAKAAGGSE